MSPCRYYTLPLFQRLRGLLRSFCYVANIRWFIKGVNHSTCNFWTILSVGIVYCTFAYLPAWTHFTHLCTLSVSVQKYLERTSALISCDARTKTIMSHTIRLCASETLGIGAKELFLDVLGAVHRHLLCSGFITTFYATLQWEPVRHSAALFMTFLYMKYSLRKFPIWNIHSECCWGCFPAHKLLTAFQSYQVFRACSSLDIKAVINEHWLLREWMSFITHSITFDFCFSGISTVLLLTCQSMLLDKWIANFMFLGKKGAFLVVNNFGNVKRSYADVTIKL